MTRASGAGASAPGTGRKSRWWSGVYGRKTPRRGLPGATDGANIDGANSDGANSDADSTDADSTEHASRSTRTIGAARPARTAASVASIRASRRPTATGRGP